MPNNYMIGVDVDSDEVVLRKLQDAETKLKKINAVLSKRQSVLISSRENGQHLNLQL